MTDILKIRCSLIFIVISLVFSGAAIAEDIRIALRAHKGAQESLKQWQSTADYLTDRIPGYRFVMVPFENNSALNQAISRGEYHFSLTNPASAVEHRIRYGTRALATLINKRQGQGYTEFGSVIFVRAERKDINELKDLKGKTFIGVDEVGFGGWRVAWNELLKNGVNPYVDFKSLIFAGGDQQKAVYAVRDGSADAGSVRTDMLERLATSGNIDLSNFKIIGQKKTEGFPFLHSTDLYPEWLFSADKKMDANLKTQVVAALFSITSDDIAARNGKYIGWASPLDYMPVENLLKELRVGPYHVAKMNEFERLVNQYGKELLVISVAFVFLIFLTLYMLRQNRRIVIAKASLKKEVVLRENLERQLMRSQKMESLGRLTGGIAHDFNNMLAAILGFTDLAIASGAIRKDGKLSGYLEQIRKAGEKGKNLVSQMLAFSRTEGSIDKSEVLLVSAVIEEVNLVLRPLLPSSIDLVVKENKKELYINADQAMLDQVLFNIYLNAKDAITENHGVISISTEIMVLDHTYCNSCHQDISGTYIAIQVEDTGSGIDASSKEHLFDPFFSTKEVGKGTGMGLSLAHGIIHKHGGHILVDSKIGQGTIIKIILPQVSRPNNTKRSNKDIQSVTDKSKNTHKHILIVDDEVAITIYLSELLQQYGYKVKAFNNSQDALAYFEANYDEIDLVLTDQTMPNITGAEMAEKMLEVRNDIPIILCTGFSESVNENTALAMNISSYMEKPIRADELLNTISSLVS